MGEQTEVCYPLVYSPNACHRLDRTGPKLGVRNTIWVSHMDGRNPMTSSTTWCLMECELVGS